MTLLADLTDLIFPRRCLGCSGPLGALCPHCLPTGPARQGADGVWFATPYDGAVRAALLAYKERDRRDLAPPLATLLARSVAAARCAEPGVRRVVLVAAPSARSVAARRGGDHVARLARRAGAQCGVGTAGGVLRLTRQVRDSAGLGVVDRERNLAGAVLARPGPGGVAALLVDDIVTTGVTLRECARALGVAGWPVAGAAVVAATTRRSPCAPGPLAEHSQSV